MTTVRAFFHVAILCVTMISAHAGAATNKQTSDMQAKQAEVARLLDTACIEVLTGDAVGRYAHLGQSWSLLDLLNPDPEKNLAAQYPTILMNNDQLDNFVANYYPRKRIKDPAYRTEQYWYYPMISAGVPEAGGRQIIGHYDSIARAAKYIDSRAKGKRASKMLGFVGPAGTGKTEIGNLLVTARGILSMTDADYYQFTFEFTNLQDIEGLEPLLYGANSAGQSSALKDVSLGRSPLVLLPESLQKKVTAIARDKFREKVGKKGLKMDPLPWTLQSGKTREVVDAIITHYARKENVAAVTEKDYLRWLTPHVRVVRRPYETMQPPDIIRYLGKHPDMATIYFTENLALSQFYGPKNPLSYSYGLVPSNDGKPVFIDEFFRQTGEFRDSSLDLAQNQTAQNGGAPPEQLNITLYFATNDESIETAMGEGGAKAHLSRTIRLPMRHALEPWHVVKIAINDIGRARFWMRKIDGVPDVMVGDAEKPETTPEATSTDLVPYDPQLVIPDMENGTMVGSDGRYALYYRPDSEDKPILISPRALWMMGMVASSTRMVLDSNAYQKAIGKGDFSTFAKFGQYFTNAIERLHVLNGTKQVDSVVAGELQKARDIMKEGQHGIGARGVENWFSEALAIAENKTGTVSPATIDEAFKRSLNKEGFEATAAERGRWITLNNLVKSDMILPALTADVLAIVQGQGRAEHLYDDIKLEIITLKNDRDAQFIVGEGNDTVPIDKSRLNEIYGIFQEISGYAFEPGLLSDFHVQVSRDSAAQRLPELLEACRRYLSKREIDKTTISSLLDYFNGKPVNETLRMMGAQAEAQLLRYGYDRPSFIEALKFVREQQHILNNQARK